MVVLYLHASDKSRIRPTLTLQSFWGCIMPVRPKILNWIRLMIQHYCWNHFLFFFNKKLFDQHRYELCLVYHHLIFNFYILYASDAMKCMWRCEDNKVVCLCLIFYFLFERTVFVSYWWTLQHNIGKAPSNHWSWCCGVVGKFMTLNYT